MNILFVTPVYPKRGQPATGFPNYLYRVSLSLIQLGHKPIILAAGDSDSYRVEQNIEIKIVKVPLYAFYKSQTLNYIFKAIKVGFFLNQGIEKIIKEMNIDIVQFTSLSGIAMLYKGTAPAVLRLSSYAKTYYSTFQTYSKSLVNVMSFFERMSAKRCNAIFAPCKNTADAFGKDCGRKVKVIETPFVNDVQEYDNKYVDTYLKEKKYVLFFGTLYAEKGILVISKILQKFLKDNPEYYFVFIGGVYRLDGECVTQILRSSAGRYADRIIILKAMLHRQLYPIIKCADFVVLPSLMDNMPNACIEAMHFEKVVIGTDGASFEQLIVHGENGLLCKIGDSQDLLRKMQIAVSMTKEEKMQMGTLAKQRIDKLRPEYTVKKLLQLYRYILENYKEL